MQSKLHHAMEMSLNLTKEFLLRKELLEKIEKETLQAEEVGEGKTRFFWCFSPSVDKDSESATLVFV